uniref:XK-related protein n=1 Tax=Aceria tosichella TaxID=561515 RepID=A0A6G1SR57_9ACAR
MASLRLLSRADRSSTPSKFNDSNVSQDDDAVFELIVPTRVNGLQNAANRTRSPNQDQFVFVNNDDSIIGETTTEDLVDGVDLRTKRIEMSFSLLDAASLIFSMTSFFLDLVFDIAVACFHYLNNDYWYCALTLAFIILPTFTTTAISLRWYIVDSQVEGAEPISKSQWIIRFIFHILQIGPILRYYESLQYGLKFRETEDPAAKKKIYMKMIYEDADATMLRLFESFMESAPQLMLQVYIITQNYPFDDYEYWTAIAQVMSITSSLFSISWSLVSYAKSLRISLANKIPMTYWSIGVMFLWEFFFNCS